MKWVLIIVGVVVLLAAAAGFGIYKLYTFGSDELKPMAHETLTDLDAGEYEAVYERAAKLFRDNTALADLRVLMERRKAALGAYQEIQSVEGVNVKTASEEGTTATLTTRLRYENGETDGVFRFVKENDVWKLAGFDLSGLDEPSPDGEEETPADAPEPEEAPAPGG